MAGKKKVAEEKQSASEQLRIQLAGLKTKSLLTFANEASNKDIQVMSTGFPQLDAILHDKLMGLPRGRNIEMYSRKGSSGKSSLAASILANVQRNGGLTAYADVEDTTTNDYLELNGCITDPRLAPNDIAALVKLEHDQYQVVPAETWLENVRKLSPIMDLIVVDSVASLERGGDLDKEMDDPNGVGGVSKIMSEFCRKTIRKKASILWINQMRSAVGVKSYNGPAMMTPGGKALDFYSSIRLELTEIEKVVETKGEPPIGKKVKVYCEKNKIAAPYRQTFLTYINGIGFSRWWDYLTFGIQTGAVVKKGSWFLFKNYRTQGLANMHQMLVEDPEMFDALRANVDGEDLVSSSVTDGREPTKDDIERALEEEVV